MIEICYFYNYGTVTCSLRIQIMASLEADNQKVIEFEDVDVEEQKVNEKYGLKP